MSLLTSAIGLAKKAKHSLKDEIDRRTPVYLSPVRRIERVRTQERVCAMTFDDGPMNLPASPDNHGGKPLTLVLIETLEKYDAKGTFDIIGDTSNNYPDKAGKHGSASWGGISYDHYPDIHKDNMGGARHCPGLVSRILSGGHQITNHTYSHVLYGKKSVVYGSRKYMNSIDDVIADLARLDDLLRDDFGYKMTMTRPPHYVDRIKGGFSSYDACAAMGYQYMAASFDGAGWLPLKTYEQEVEAVWKPIETALKADPDALCGQIIFQKDGYNMARRTPIADGLEKALEVLSSYGYKVVTVEELMKYSPFEDLGEGDELFPAACLLLQSGYTVAYKNNKVLPENPLTLGELIMMLYGREGADKRLALMKGREKLDLQGIKADHPYSGALAIALEKEIITSHADINGEVDLSMFNDICRKVYGKTATISMPINHGKAIAALAELTK